jgi:hypothetical protein
MRYPNKIVKIPIDLAVGAKVGVSGEGNDTYTITGIEYSNGMVAHVQLSCMCREPLCKIYLLRGRDHIKAMQDPTSWIEVVIGECDICGKKFPDSCVYHRPDGGDANSMICTKCHNLHVTKSDLFL